MTVIDLIKREHDAVADLFDHLVVLARDRRRVEDAAVTATRLVAAVRVHARAEERVLYETIASVSAPLKAFSLSGPHAHEDLDTTLDKLLVRQPGSDEYAMIVRVARDLFVMHARDEEEAEVLPLLAGALSPEELAALADDLRAEEGRIRPHILRLVGMPAWAA